MDISFGAMSIYTQFDAYWKNRNVDASVFQAAVVKQDIIFYTSLAGTLCPFQYTKAKEFTVKGKTVPPFFRANFITKAGAAKRPEKTQQYLQRENKIHPNYPLWIAPGYDYTQGEVCYLTEGLSDAGSMLSAGAPAIAARDKGSITKVKKDLDTFLNAHPNIKTLIITPDVNGWDYWAFNVWYLDIPIQFHLINIKTALSDAGVPDGDDVNDLWKVSERDAFFSRIHAAVETVTPPYDWLAGGEVIDNHVTVEWARDWAAHELGKPWEDDGVKDWRILDQGGLTLMKDVLPIRWFCHGANIGSQGLLSWVAWVRHQTASTQGIFNDLVLEFAEKLGLTVPLVPQKTKKSRVAEPPPPPPTDATTEKDSDEIYLGTSVQIKSKSYPTPVASMAQTAWYVISKKDDSTRFFFTEAELVYIKKGKPKTLDLAHLRNICNELILWTMFTEEGRVQRSVPADIPDHMFYNDVMRDHPLPELKRIVYAPYFDKAGVFHTKPGYHQNTGTLFFENGTPLTMPDVPEAPTPEDVHKAKGWVHELLFDFPFSHYSHETPWDNPEKANSVALMLEPLIRSWFPLTPLYVIEAPTPRTGKTKLAKMLMYPALGQYPDLSTAPTREEEWSKTLTAIMRELPAAVVFDNLHGKINSASLNSILTNDGFHKARLLNTSSAEKFPNVSTWIVTGNNPSFSDELCGRAVRIRLEAMTENPSERGGFRHDPVEQWAVQHRGDLVWSLAVLVKNYLAQGRPAPKRQVRKGSFESWVPIMNGILECNGIYGFLGNHDEFRTSSMETHDDLKPLVEEWLAEDKLWNDGSPVPLMINDLYLRFFKVTAKDDGFTERVRDREDPPVDVAGEGDKERRRRLGSMLGRSAGKVYTVTRGPLIVTVQLRKGKKTRNRVPWTLEVVETQQHG